MANFARIQFPTDQFPTCSLSLTFIAFTVCPSFEDAYNKKIFAKYNVSKSEYLDGNFRPNTTEFYNEATFNLTEILYQIIVTTGSTMNIFCTIKNVFIKKFNFRRYRKAQNLCESHK